MSKSRLESPLPILGNNGDAIAFNDQEGQTSLTTTTGISAGAVHYIPIPVDEGVAHSVFLGYHDGTVATSAAELQVTNRPKRLVGDTDEDADNWSTESGITVPTHAAGVGADMVDISSISAKRARIKLTLSANGPVSAWPGNK